MATFKASEEKNYGGGGYSNNGFFSISKNHGIKRIRFYIDNEDDVQGNSVHKVKVGDKERYVDCLRAYDEPISNCPFCAEKMKLESRYFIPVYNIDEDAAQIWDRGATYLSRIARLCSKYAKKHPLIETVFEVERDGEPKDTKTRYEIDKWEPDEDDDEAWDSLKSVDELPDPPKILGGFVLEKTAEEMEYYIEHGEFPSDGGDEKKEPPRRRGGSEDHPESTVRRRTPAGRDERF